MIPDFEDIRLYLSNRTGKKAAVREIIRHFGVPESNRPAFRRMMKNLSLEGFLVRIRGGRYALPESLNVIEGVFHAHPDGYGFVNFSNGKESLGKNHTLEDTFIPATRRGTALHGDRVLIKCGPSSRRGWEGEVIRVLERGADLIIGRIETKAGSRWFVPLDHRFGKVMAFEREGDNPEARRGMVVLFQITGYPTGRRAPRRKGKITAPSYPVASGRIVRIIGYPEDPQVAIDMICAEFGIRTEFPEKVLEEANALHVPDFRDLNVREDLRGLLTVTIDDETAHDFDDAVSLEILADGARRLGVHIADVSHYVTEGSSLDEEALLRGTSTYFPGAAVHMLPAHLSRDLCSLLPEQDRLALTVWMDFDKRGHRIASRTAHSVIRSRARLTYSDVSKFLGDEVADQSAGNVPPNVTPMEEYSKVLGLEETLRAMAALAKQLRDTRLSEGGLDLDIPESEVLVDDAGQVSEVRCALRLIAHKMIEDFMLAANRVVGELLTGLSKTTQVGKLDGTAQKEKPEAGMFRVHEPPDSSKLEKVALLLRNFHHHVPSLSSTSPEGLRLILKATRGLPEETLVNMGILRAMKLARYDSENLGHYGLGFTHYTHFTSPIRRYPDLLVHRLLRARGLIGSDKVGRRRLQSFEDRLPSLAEKASSLERSSGDAERAMLDYKRAQFMQDRVGEVYDGKVSGIIPAGFFVTLDVHFVDGFVPLADLSDDYYKFIEEDYELIGRRTKRTIRFGDPVTVYVAQADLDQRRISFSLVEPTNQREKRTFTKADKTTRDRKRLALRKSNRRTSTS